MQQESRRSRTNAGPAAGTTPDPAPAEPARGAVCRPVAGRDPQRHRRDSRRPRICRGWRTSGQVLTLNSYENRVFQVGLEAGPAAGGWRPMPPASPAPLIAKFYRPGRWTDAQILEEHAFLQELAEAEVPAVAALCHGRPNLALRSRGFGLPCSSAAAGVPRSCPTRPCASASAASWGACTRSGRARDFAVRQRLGRAKLRPRTQRLLAGSTTGCRPSW
jgi:hypothetical protein